jgi:hypothetical protein
MLVLVAGCADTTFAPDPLPSFPESRVVTLPGNLEGIAARPRHPGQLTVTMSEVREWKLVDPEGSGRAYRWLRSPGRTTVNSIAGLLVARAAPDSMEAIDPDVSLQVCRLDGDPVFSVRSEWTCDDATVRDDGTVVAVFSDQDSLHVVGYTPNGVEVMRLRLPRSHPFDLNSLSPDGRRAARRSPTWDIVELFPDHGATLVHGNAEGMGFSIDGERLSYVIDDTVRVLEGDGSVAEVGVLPPGYWSDLAWHEDGFTVSGTNQAWWTFIEGAAGWTASEGPSVGELVRDAAGGIPFRLRSENYDLSWTLRVEDDRIERIDARFRRRAGEVGTLMTTSWDERGERLIVTGSNPQVRLDGTWTDIAFGLFGYAVWNGSSIILVPFGECPDRLLRWDLDPGFPPAVWRELRWDVCGPFVVEPWWSESGELIFTLNVGFGVAPFRDMSIDLDTGRIRERAVSSRVVLARAAPDDPSLPAGAQVVADPRSAEVWVGWPGGSRTPSIGDLRFEEVAFVPHRAMVAVASRRNLHLIPVSQSGARE